MRKLRRWAKTHHKTVVAIAMTFGYLLHLTVEGALLGLAGAKLQALGYISV